MTTSATPISSSSATASARSNEAILRSMRLDPDDVPSASLALDQTTWTLWLHVRWHYGCYYLYAEYYFEAWITSTADPNGPRQAIDTLELKWRHGSTRGHEVSNGVDMVAKDEKVYASFFVCDTDLCARGVATYQGVTWGVASPQDCST
jgi:hypothetical protein